MYDSRVDREVVFDDLRNLFGQPVVGLLVRGTDTVVNGRNILDRFKRGVGKHIDRLITGGAVDRQHRSRPCRSALFGGIARWD